MESSEVSRNETMQELVDPKFSSQWDGMGQWKDFN